MKHAKTMIAESLNWDVKEVSECRYQKYVNPAVYSIGERYFAASISKPKHDVGTDWFLYDDQFGVRNSNMKIWFCLMGISS